MAPDLTTLNGPVDGVVELPIRLFWQERRRINISIPDVLRWMYETVLREAASTAELRTWLDGATLVRLWPELFLPSGVRAAWEDRYPQLRRRMAAA